VEKKVMKKIKIEIQAGQATPAPPVGTVLGPVGINLQEFCSQFNEKTKDKMGDILPVEITVYEDRSFNFVVKTPPTPFLIKKFAKIKTASAKGANEVVATLSKEDIKAIAEIKMPDLNAYDLENAIKIVTGTATNMGIAIKGVTDTEMAEQAEQARLEEIEMAKREAELEKMESELAEEVEPEVLTEKETDEEETDEEEKEETKNKEEEKKE